MWTIWNGITVAWELEWFDKETEIVAGSMFLQGFSESDMRPVLLVDDESLCGGAYPIDEGRALRLQKLTGVEIDLGKYDYFLGVSDTGLTEADPSIKPGDFPKQEVWYPAPRDLSEAFGELAKVTPKTPFNE